MKIFKKIFLDLSSFFASKAETDWELIGHMNLCLRNIYFKSYVGSSLCVTFSVRSMLLQILSADSHTQNVQSQSISHHFWELSGESYFRVSAVEVEHPCVPRKALAREERRTDGPSI